VVGPAADLPHSLAHDREPSVTSPWRRARGLHAGVIAAAAMMPGTRGGAVHFLALLLSVALAARLAPALGATSALPQTETAADAGGWHYRHQRRHMPRSRSRFPPAAPNRPSTVDCDWKYYTQPLSHFSEGSTQAGNASFRQRVCIISKHWRKQPSAGPADVKGPILFCKS
jgi:hypothetical protein